MVRYLDRGNAAVYSRPPARQGRPGPSPRKRQPGIPSSFTLGLNLHTPVTRKRNSSARLPIQNQQSCSLVNYNKYAIVYRSLTKEFIEDPGNNVMNPHPKTLSTVHTTTTEQKTNNRPTCELQSTSAPSNEKNSHRKKKDKKEKLRPSRTRNSVQSQHTRN
jgi:hypothetical protein